MKDFDFTEQTKILHNGKAVYLTYAVKWSILDNQITFTSKRLYSDCNLVATKRKEFVSPVYSPNWIKNSVYWFIDYQGDAWFLCLELSPKRGHYTYDTSVEFDFEYKGEIGTGEVGIHRYEVR